MFFITTATDEILFVGKAIKNRNKSEDLPIESILFMVFGLNTWQRI